jgi:peptidoglycan biosynthesis protein MviN/MurJ (putative lipid II flippase)
LVVLRLPAVRLVFGSDEFRWESTVLTGYTLAYLTIGMLAQSLVYLLVRSFYALQDTVTPLKVGIITTIIQVSVGFALIAQHSFPVWGLALSYALAVNIQALLLFILFYRRVGGFGLRSFFRPIVRMVTAGGVTGALTYMVFKMLDRYSWGQNLSLGPIQLPTTLYNVIIDTSFTLNLIYYTAIILVFGLGLYVFLAYLMGVAEVKLLLNLMTKGKRITRFVK